MTIKRGLQITVGAVASAVALSGCGFTPYDLPLPGGADTGDKPYTVTAEFRDVLDLVPQSGVRVNDIAVGKVTDVQLDGWNAKVTLEINDDAKLPDNAVASIRQTSLLGEKFVSLAPPESGATGQLSDGDEIPLARTGRNPELEEVLSAASLLFNGGGLERTNTIVKELNQTLDGNEPEIRELLDMYGGVRNSAPQLQRFLTALAVRRAAMEQQRRDIEAVLQEIDMLERQCEALLGDNAEGAAAARAELVRRIDRASVG